MDTEHTAKQLELAAAILRTGHPFGYRILDGRHRKYTSPLEVITDGNLLIMLLATPPDSRPLHNPDNLTAEQVGAGYRLALKGEKQPVGYQYWNSPNWHNGQADGKLVDTCNKDTSIRIPLSTPWPEVEKPDPYAELKAAHKAGKVIQVKDGNDWVDQLMGYNWAWPPQYYRIKPEPVFTFTLPTPPPDMQWHRIDGWEKGDLPQGWRPLVKGEEYQRGDRFTHDFGAWITISTKPSLPLADCKVCTTRPLVFTHAGKEWTWHRAGDPMPCDGGAKLQILRKDGVALLESIPARNRTWDTTLGESYQLLGWRYADKPEPREVDLGPEDVPPNSALRLATWDAGVHVMPSVWRSGVSFAIREKVDFTTYTNLRRDGWLINRPRHRDADGNPTLWEPCSKKVEG